MSLATLKKKTQTKYNNMSVNSGFYLNGTTRNQGYIGQTSLSRSLPKTIMQGVIMHGHGGCCGTFQLKPAIQSGVDYQNDFMVKKTSVLNTKGMLANRKTKYLDSENNLKSQVVKSDSNQNNNTQVDFINIKKESTIASVDSSNCQPYVYQTECGACKFENTYVNSCDNACSTQLNKPKRYNFISEKSKHDSNGETKDITTMSQSAYLENMRKSCYSVELINRIKQTNIVTNPTNCGE